MTNTPTQSDPGDQILRVNEIFFSIQGEGHLAGTPMWFIRLSGCKAAGACYAAGIRCDTEWNSGRELTLTQIQEEMMGMIPPGDPFPHWILWTGGEPLDQLTPEILSWFNEHFENSFQALETSGLHSHSHLSSYIDHTTLSPKVSEHVLRKNFPDGIRGELRYIRHKGQGIPEPSVHAEHLFISPHSDGDRINTENLHWCVGLVKENPQWRLSVQQHKIFRLR